MAANISKNSLGGGVKTTSYNIVLAGSAASGATCRMLIDAGFACEAVPADDRLPGVVADRRPTVVLISANSGAALNLLRALKTEDATSHVPVAVVDENGGADARIAFYDAGADDVFRAEAEISELRARLPGLARISTMEAELVRRAATVAEHGGSLPTHTAPESSNRAFRMLVVGPGSGEFQAVWQELRRSGFELTAETDPYRARSLVQEDHGDKFDGALVYVPDETVKEKSVYFCQSLRNDRRLFDFPLLLASEKGVFADTAEAFSSGASVFRQTPLDGVEMVVRLRLLMRVRHRKRVLGAVLAQAMSPAVADPIGSIFSSEFLRSHIARLSDKKADRGIASTGILFSVPTIGGIAAQYGEEAAAVLRRQVADWLSALVRIEDLVARAGPDAFLVVLPETSAADADFVRLRVTGVLHQSEFKLTDDVPVGVEIDLLSGMSSIGPGDTMDTVIQRANDALE